MDDVIRKLLAESDNDLAKMREQTIFIKGWRSALEHVLAKIEEAQPKREEQTPETEEYNG